MDRDDLEIHLEREAARWLANLIIAPTSTRVEAVRNVVKCFDCLSRQHAKRTPHDFALLLAGVLIAIRQAAGDAEARVEVGP